MILCCSGERNIQAGREFAGHPFRFTGASLSEVHIWSPNPAPSNSFEYGNITKKCFQLCYRFSYLVKVVPSQTFSISLFTLTLLYIDGSLTFQLSTILKLRNMRLLFTCNWKLLTCCWCIWSS